MRFDIENMGVLTKASIELGDLTIVCGRNNTGKTYITNSIFGFLERWHDYIPVHDDDNTGLRLGLSSLFKQGTQTVPVDEYLKNSNLILQAASQVFETNLAATFGSQPAKFTKTRFRCSVETEKFGDLSDGVSRLGSADKEFLRLRRDAKDRQIIIELIGRKNTFTQMPREILRDLVSDLVRQACFETIFPRPLISSSERTGIATFGKHLNFAMSNLMDRIRAGDEDIEPHEFMSDIKSGYPISIECNVAFSRKLEEATKASSFLKDENSEILNKFNNILGGTYRLTNDDRLYYQPKRGKSRLTMRESASSIRSLLDIYFYLNHVVQKGDILMIDEPEQSLHPHNQRLLARVLCQLVNAGIKIFITTHSDYIIREVNSLIMMNGDSPRQRGVPYRFGYSDDELIDPRKIRIYEAKSDLMEIEGYSKRVSRLTLVPVIVDPNFGIAAKVFDTEINEMNSIQDEVIWGSSNNDH